MYFLTQTSYFLTQTLYFLTQTSYFFTQQITQCCVKNYAFQMFLRNAAYCGVVLRRIAILLQLLWLKNTSSYILYLIRTAIQPFLVYINVSLSHYPKCIAFPNIRAFWSEHLSSAGTPLFHTELRILQKTLRGRTEKCSV